MTTRAVTTPEAAHGRPVDGMLPDPVRTPDMQQEPIGSEIRTVLRLHFSHRSDVLVGGEGYLCWNTRRREGWLVPDCVVAFGVDPDAVRNRNGYVIDDVGKPPEVVVEIASESTGRADYTRKREGYASYGVGEYWRFDHTGGRYHDRPMSGDMLVDGEYEPITVERDRDGVIRGHSPTLGLDLCWDDRRLRFYDPAKGEYLLDLPEAEDRVGLAEARAEAAEAEVMRLRDELGRLQSR